MEEYGGWRGAAVVLSGLFLNMCVCGALFRDLEWTARRKRKKDEAKKSQSRKISGEQSKSSNYRYFDSSSYRVTTIYGANYCKLWS